MNKAARLLLLCVGWAALEGCFLRPPYGVVNVVDADRLASQAVRVVVTIAPDLDPQTVPIQPGEMSDGMLVTLIALRSGPHVVRIDAELADGTVMARAVVDMQLTNTDQAQVQAVLGVPCEHGAEDQCTAVPGCGLGACSERGVCGCGACGDGRVDPGEQCDDGDDANPYDGCDGCRLHQWVPEVVVGLAADPTTVPLDAVNAITVDQDGNVFFAATDLDQGQAIWRIDAATGTLTRFAGGGEIPLSTSVDGAVASTLSFAVRDVRADGLGELYVLTGEGVLRIDRAGRASMVVGDRVCGTRWSSVLLPPEGADARAACFDDARGIAIDGDGDLFVADPAVHLVYRIDSVTELLSVYAGTGLVGEGTPGTPATLYPLPQPSLLALDTDGRLYVLAQHDDGPAVHVVRDGLGDTVVRGLGLIAVHDVELRTPGKLLLGTSNGVLQVADDGTVLNLQDVEGAERWPHRSTRATALAVDAFGNLYLFRSENRKLYLYDGNTAVWTAGSDDYLPCCDGVPGIAAKLGVPEDLARLPSGEVLVTSRLEKRIRKLDTDWRIETLIGTGEEGTPRENITELRDQRIREPRSVAAAYDGTLYFADAAQGTSVPAIHRIAPGSSAVATVGGLAVGRPLILGPEDAGAVTDLVVDAARNSVLFIDETGQLVRRLDLESGEVETVVGIEDWNADLLVGTPRATWLQEPSDLALDGGRRLYVTDAGAGMLYRVDLQDDTICVLVRGSGLTGPACGDGPSPELPDFAPTSVAVSAEGQVVFASGSLLYGLDPVSFSIDLIAGQGAPGTTGDGGPPSGAGFTDVLDIIVDEKGLTILDRDFVRRIEEERMTTVAGPIHLGDGPLLSARLQNPAALVRQSEHAWFIADGAGGRIRQLDFGTARLTTVVGYPNGPTPHPLQLAHYAGLLDGATGVALSQAGFLYVAEQGQHVVHRVSLGTLNELPEWTITPFVGMPGQEGVLSGQRSETRLSSPAGLALDGETGTLFVADAGSHTVRAVQTVGLQAGETTVVLGTPGQRGVVAEGVPAAQAYLNGPQALRVVRDAADTLHLYVADTGNHRVLRVTDPLSEGAVSTVVVGDGAPNSSGEGSPARFFPVESPGGLVVDGYGNLYVTSANTVRQVLAGPDGLADGSDEVRTLFGRAPRVRFPEPVTQCLTDVDIDEADEGQARLLVLDACQGFVIRLERVLVAPPSVVGGSP